MKVFVTVGTQLPFDRMIRAVDDWASRNPNAEVFAQIGPSGYTPTHARWVQFLDAPACREELFAADLVIAHAGMGTILTSLEAGKPIIVMPRRASLGEHRNDHQLSTVRHLATRGLIRIAYDADELTRQLDTHRVSAGADPIAAVASARLLGVVRDFIQTGSYRVSPVGPAAVSVKASPNRPDPDMEEAASGLAAD